MLRHLQHRIPPPVIDAAFALLMWGVARAWPAAQLWPRGQRPWALGAALGLLLAGAVLALAGVHAFRRARTTLNPLAPARARTLVTTGVYRLSRNPMYLGMLLALAAWGVYLGHAAAFAALPLFVLTLNALQIIPEERVMRERFGAAFDRYVAKARRWI